MILKATAARGAERKGRNTAQGSSLRSWDRLGASEDVLRGMLPAHLAWGNNSKSTAFKDCRHVGPMAGRNLARAQELGAYE